MMSLLAGFVEPGETLETAVRREVWEETAVRIGAVSYLTSQPWPFPSSLMVGCRAQALSTEITIDPVEIEHALWLRRQELLDVFSGARKDIFPARRGSVAHFLLRNWLAGSIE
jgi:NAD+ diphosphatase